MQKKISKAAYERARHLDLLLLADPEEAAIMRYIGASIIFECVSGGKLAGIICVVLDGAGTVEIKNIAVLDEFSRMGIGSELIKHTLSSIPASRFIVGTADTSLEAISFYNKNGFVKKSVIKDFFIDNYASAIFENGKQCRDMILLEWRNQ